MGIIHRIMTRVGPGWFSVPAMPFSVRESKVSLIRDLSEASSVRDYGGLWGVDGMYLEEAVRHLGCRLASMIDSLPASEAWRVRMDRMKSELGCEVEFRRADFREERIFSGLQATEISLLYDILLHQENVVHVLQRVLEKTTRSVCVAQPVIKDAVFPFPNACINLQFYPRDLKQKIRGKYSGWPEEPLLDHFFPGHWIWGQTVSYLNSIFHGLGWQIEYSRSYPLSRYLDYAFLRYGRVLKPLDG